MKKIIIILIIFFAPSLLFAESKIVIIVNKENSIKNITYNDLIKIFKQEKKYWSAGKKIYFVMHESGTYEKEIILERIYKMDEQELKKFWLSKIFKGDITSFPKTLGSGNSVKIFVSSVPGAVGYIREEELDDTVSVLKIEDLDNGEFI